MLFTSIIFLCFVTIFAVAVKLVPKQYCALVVFLSCLIFYAQNSPVHIMAMAWVVTGALFFPRNKRVVGVCFLLMPLAYFKYFEFITTSVLDLSLSADYMPTSIPPGISFVTFTAITYILTKPKQNQHSIMENVVHPVNYLLFFPQVIAGPIVRPHELYQQLKAGLNYNKLTMQLGLFLFLLGILKKFMLADQIGYFVDNAFLEDAENKFIGVILFPWQIYFDFSAYTDMALGLAFFFGITLPQNFNAPYQAKNLTDFWRCWHMTLSKFFRDYVYKPLGGSRGGRATLIVSMFATFFLSGLWHGADWNFILWGGLNGVFVLMEKLVGLDKSKSLIYFLLTQILIIFLWVSFRIPIDQILPTLSLAVANFGGDNLFTNLIVIFIVIGFFITHKFDVLTHHKNTATLIPINVLFPLMLVIMFCVMIITGGSSEKFIYFDF